MKKLKVAVSCATIKDMFLVLTRTRLFLDNQTYLFLFLSGRKEAEGKFKPFSTLPPHAMAGTSNKELGKATVELQGRGEGKEAKRLLNELRWQDIVERYARVHP